MSCYRLVSYDAPLPGNFPYEQSTGVYKRFPAEPLIEAQARNVAAWRKANGLPRSSVIESLEDVDHYQCSSRGNPKGLCIPCSGAAAQVALGQSSPIVAPCGGCGAKVT